MFAIYQLANAGTAARQRRRDDRTADLIGCDGFHRGPNWLLIIATALAVVICANAMLGGTQPGADRPRHGAAHRHHPRPPHRPRRLGEGRAMTIADITKPGTTKDADLGPWIYTRSGRRLYLLHPEASDIDLNDIVHSLAHQGRFTGHAQAFYSIAQHSVVVADMVARTAGATVEDQKWALIHDFPEFAIGDIAGPLKSILSDWTCRLLDQLEMRWMAVIACRFGLLPPGAPFTGFPPVVDRADKIALATERPTLLPLTKPWPGLPPADPDTCIKPLPPDHAECLFWQRFHDLFGEIQ